MIAVIQDCLLVSLVSILHRLPYTKQSGSLEDFANYIYLFNYTMIYHSWSYNAIHYVFKCIRDLMSDAGNTASRQQQ